MKQGVKEVTCKAHISKMSSSSSDLSFLAASEILCPKISQLWCCHLLPLFLNFCTNFTSVCTATKEDIINCLGSLFQMLMTVAAYDCLVVGTCKLILGILTCENI